MIKIEDSNGDVKCNIEGNIETVIKDFGCAVASVYNVLIQCHGFDKKEAKDLLKQCVKTSIKSFGIQDVYAKEK